MSDVSFTVTAGETFGLVGESGCGKTTIGRVVVALERPNSGSVLLGGQDISALSGGELRRQRRDLQLMFQDPYSSLDPRMRVGSIIREPLSIQRAGTRQQQQRRVFELRGAGIKGELPSPVRPPSGCRFRTRCPYAQDKCAEDEPQLRTFGPGHVAACHFPLQSQPAGAGPGISSGHDPP